MKKFLQGWAIITLLISPCFSLQSMRDPYLRSAENILKENEGGYDLILQRAGKTPDFFANLLRQEKPADQVIQEFEQILGPLSDTQKRNIKRALTNHAVTMQEKRGQLKAHIVTPRKGPKNPGEKKTKKSKKSTESSDASESASSPAPSTVSTLSTLAVIQRQLPSVSASVVLPTSTPLAPATNSSSLSSQPRIQVSEPSISPIVAAPVPTARHAQPISTSTPTTYTPTQTQPRVEVPAAPAKPQQAPVRIAPQNHQPERAKPQQRSQPSSPAAPTAPVKAVAKPAELPVQATPVITAPPKPKQELEKEGTSWVLKFAVIGTVLGGAGYLLYKHYLSDAKQPDVKEIA
jgi:hypothetical protein